MFVSFLEVVQLSKKEIILAEYFPLGSKCCSEDMPRADGAEDVKRLEEGKIISPNQNKFVLEPEDGTAQRNR